VWANLDYVSVTTQEDKVSQKEEYAAMHRIVPYYYTKSHRLNLNPAMHCYIGIDIINDPMWWKSPIY